MSDRLVDLSDRIAASGLGFLSPMGPVLLAATALGLVADTRSFARLFEVAHALVIREAVSLDADLGLLATEDRDEKSRRLFLSLTEAGAALTGGAVA
ncbi:hypothetical protein [Oceanicola sp. S124]|uniref:hypothetical protein n=1 Tax=Oceanicola sp. S124 TaxID=1042378 RepID=UPI0002557DBD|nr:hypothetical protein [Oceanicola sp. S124]